MEHFREYRIDGGMLVTGLIVGEFGIDKRNGDRVGYVVTHLRTGLASHRDTFRTKRNAVRWARLLLKHGGKLWTDRRFSFGVVPKKGSALRRDLAAVAKRCAKDMGLDFP